MEERERCLHLWKKKQIHSEKIRTFLSLLLVFNEIYNKAKYKHYVLTFVRLTYLSGCCFASDFHILKYAVVKGFDLNQANKARAA